MTTITGITSNPYQIVAITLQDGSVAYITLYFRTQQNGWYADISYSIANVSWPGVKGMKLTSSPNILRQWRNTIPFGLMLVSSKANGIVGGLDPITINDFQDGSIAVYLLSPSDVQAVEGTFYSKANP